jgi:trimethylamine--corrinoid protein Co-methyltransferase
MMERTGMRFFDREALDLFKKAGAGISGENLVMSIMLQESTKPIIFVGIEADSTVMALDMAAAAAGGLKALQQYPFVINYVNTVSAFHHNGESLKRLLYAAERNIPSIYAPGSTRGILAPITFAGAMAHHNAGQLAGLVLSQLKREGSPLILCGRNGGFMDMRTLVSPYTAPEAGPYG